ncbi:MAG TPA: helix-turn-helix domain-containing protein, partial [Pirellulales bacterium]
MARSVLTLPEAAQFLGVPPEELSLLRQSGALPAQQEAGEWVFNRTDLERVADGYLRPDPRRPAPYEAESPPVADNSDDDSDHALLGGALGASPVELTPQADDSGMLWQALNLDDQEVSSLAQPILDGVPTPPADAPRNGKEPRSTPPGVLEGRLLSDPSLAPNGRASVGPPGTPAPRESEPSDMHFSSFDEFDDSGDLEFGEPDSADLAPATDEELSREDSLILDGVPLLDGGFVVPPPIESGLNPFDGPGALDAMLEGPEANRWPGPPSSANSSSLSVFDEAISPTGSTASPNSGSSPGAPSPAPTSAVDFPSLSFDEHEPSNVSLDRLLGGDAFFGSAAPTSAGGGKAPVDRRGPASDLSPPDSNGPEDFPSLSFDQHEPSRAKLDRSFGPTEFAPAVEGSSLPPPNRPTDESSRALNWAADDDGELDRILGDAGEEFGSSASTEAPHDPFADLLSGDEPPLESPSGDAMPLSTAPSGPSGSGAFSHLDAPDAEDYSGLDLDTPLWSGGEPTPSGPLRSVSSYSDFDAPDDPPGALPDGGQDYTVD